MMVTKGRTQRDAPYRHIAYLLASFPEPSETFALREIEEMRRQGCTVSVWTLRQVSAEMSSGRENAPLAAVCEPKLLSSSAWAAVATLLCHPWQLCGLVRYLIRLFIHSPLWTFRLLRHLPAVAAFARAARQRDVTHIHGYFMNTPAVVAMAVGACTGIPFTLAAHARDVFIDPGPLPLLLSKAKAVIACNHRAGEALKRSCLQAPSKVRIVHHGLDLRYWMAQSAHADSDPPVILAAGRFVPKKGLTVLVRGCGLLRSRGYGFTLRLVGNGPCLEELRNLVGQQDLTMCTQFAGWLTEADLRDAMRQAAIMVVPSVEAGDGDRDGIPNVLLEAGACGLPIIATHIAGEEVLRHGQNGLLVEPDSHEVLAGSMGQLLDDRRLREYLASNARQMIERQFDLQDNVAQIRECIAASEDETPTT